MLTMPVSRSWSSTTGMWRMRRSVIVRLSVWTSSSARQVATTVVMISETGTAQEARAPVVQVPDDVALGDDAGQTLALDDDRGSDVAVGEHRQQFGDRGVGRHREDG